MLSRGWVERHSSAVVGAALVALWLGVGAVLAVWFSARIRDWSVMTDELLYAKLATSIADTGSLRASVHGLPISVWNQLYPLFLAPLYGTLSPPDAFRMAHVLNAFAMTSAVFPAYLLARLVAPRAWALAVAALSVLVPWMIVTGFLMTEVVAYPAFLWALLGLNLAIAEPSPRKDVLALAALGLAVVARTQFAVLAVVLPLAILGHEVGYARSLRAGARATFTRHWLLWAVYYLGAFAVLVVAVVDSPGRVLGVYGVTVEEGSVLPSGIWSSAAEHLDAVAIGCGLVPFVLGGGWMLATVVRPRTRGEHALATLALFTIAALTFEVASFSIRFGDEIIRDRYLFYVVPLLLVGTAAALSSGRRRDVAIGAGAATLLFAATAASLPFTIFTGVWIDSPASVLNELLDEQSGGLATGTFVALLGLFAGIALVLAVLLVSRVPLAIALAAALAVFSLLTLRSEIDRVVSSTGLSGRPLAEPPGLVLDWVDSVVPAGEEAALLAFPVSTAWDTTAIRWWDAEFWNRRIDHAYVAEDENFRYTPFPHTTLELDWETGEVPDTFDAPPYVVAAPSDSRFLLAGQTQAENLGLVVRAVARPYRALWATHGLQADGWTTPGRTATIRAYGRSENRPQPVLLQIAVRAPSTAPAEYRLATPTLARTGVLEPSAERVESIPLCLFSRLAADIALTSSSIGRIEKVQLGPAVEETRRVGVQVGPISIEPRDGEC